MVPEPVDYAGRPYRIDASVHRRFDRRMTAFSRRNVFNVFDCFVPSTPDQEDPSLPLLAEARASWILHDCFDGAFTDRMVGDHRLVAGAPPFRYRFPAPAEASEALRSAALRFGASLVGFTRVRERWLYSRERDGSLVSLPPGASWAVVMAVAMDGSGISRSPGLEAACATGRGYSAMALLSSSLAEYLRLLGYYARSSGNDTALSIPMAVDAGLGVQGRNGLLLTRRLGPCVRICKVFTDLELEPSTCSFPSPMEVCGDCTLCAEACEPKALSTASSPTWEVLTSSNNPGVLRWQFDPEKCLDYWIGMGRDCSNCISSCPASERLAAPH
ncbi:4Fe-4S dicluster domain-containing protein [Candidatus Fermentibacterales bacterium]|nr:4Fe-4S dicluster domain-containing protein [Candidatus Fermentibacterales bacterium]